MEYEYGVAWWDGEVTWHPSRDIAEKVILDWEPEGLAVLIRRPRDWEVV